MSTKNHHSQEKVKIKLTSTGHYHMDLHKKFDKLGDENNILVKYCFLLLKIEYFNLIKLYLADTSLKWHSLFFIYSKN